MDQHVFAREVAGILTGQGHEVNLQDGTTPILIAMIMEQQVVGFCFHSIFESCSRVNGNCVIDERVKEPKAAAAAELMVDTAQKMLQVRPVVQA